MTKELVNIDQSLLEEYKQELEGLSPQEQQELLAVLQEERENMAEGVTLKPVTIKIDSRTCKFLDPFDDVTDEIKGVIVHKQKARGLWRDEDEGSLPYCSSGDGRKGSTVDGDILECSRCRYNQWGSGDNGKGKACKEMRWIYLSGVEGYNLPVFISLPPTSIKPFDEYMSARATKRIFDIQQEAIIQLTEASSAKHTWARAKFKLGAKVEPRRILELNKEKKKLADYIASKQVTASDYVEEEVDDVAMDALDDL